MRPERLIQDLSAIVDPRIRVLALAEALSQGEPGTWILAISLAADLAFGRAAPTDDATRIAATRALETISHAAAAPQLSYATRQRLYEAARHRGRDEIARLFFDASPPSADARMIARQTAPERALERRGRTLTLGERRALARTHRRDALALVAKDPHPAVIAVLLGNPHLTEPDMVTIAASRAAVPAALALIAEHPKWAARHAVKRALVLNPATPLASAMRLASNLASKDLEEIQELSTLAAALRGHARELLRRRAAPATDPTPLS